VKSRKRGFPDESLGLTPAKAGTFLEAASVCLDRHHKSPINFSIANFSDTIDTIVEWDTPTDRVKAAHANRTDATEEGAYACVIAAVEIALHLYAVRRAETGTGADYYLGPCDQELQDLENCYRLEVSGTDSPSKSAVDRRLREKVEQARRGNSNLPAIAGVVGSQVKVILLEDVREPS